MQHVTLITVTNSNITILCAEMQFTENYIKTRLSPKSKLFKLSCFKYRKYFSFDSQNY